MKALRSYGFSLLLVLSLAAGVVIGRVSPSSARALRPIGDLFLNLIFMIIVPLVFFTIASSIANSGSTKKLSRISSTMLAVFLLTSAVSAFGALGFFVLFRPEAGVGLAMPAAAAVEAPTLLAQIVKAFTANDFPELISRRAMLPLIVFSAAVGIATLQLKERGEPFARVLASGAAVFMRLIDFVMYVAPVGLLAFFAATIVDTGAQLAGAYVRVFVVYYAFAALYFVVGFTAYAFAAGGWPCARRFWANMLPPSLTALGTCSSMATLPLNMEAVAKMGVPDEIADVVVPVGTAIQKDGSVIGGVAKVLFAMSLFHQPLTPGRLVLAALVGILVGVVMGAIPSGGMMGELLILSIFGLPAETLPLLAIISVIIDPAATLLNATCHNVAALLVTRRLDGNIWRDGAALQSPPTLSQPGVQP
ncbi:MAG TPA: dicarboxylate/amino acid:cation symporter [Polyangia bacterium]|nr:dicarboxylate/amino acid:cation symporter [Polyangia bacterium]